MKNVFALGVTATPMMLLMLAASSSAEITIIDMRHLEAQVEETADQESTSVKTEEGDRTLLRVKDSLVNVLGAGNSMAAQNMLQVAGGQSTTAICTYGCKWCHEDDYGPSAYNPSLQYNCRESSSCTGQNDINCCLCNYDFTYQGTKYTGNKNYLPCCSAPPTPPTPSPTLNCDCSCKTGYGTCVARKIGDGSNMCYGGGSLDSTCCACQVNSNTWYQFNCCQKTMLTKAPTRRPTNFPTAPTGKPTLRPTNFPTMPTPPVTRRPTYPTSSPTPGSTVPVNCSCRSGTFSTRPLDIYQFYMCCPSSSSLSYSCYPGC